jgi:hypothetical protein
MHSGTSTSYDEEEDGEGERDGLYSSCIGREYVAIESISKAAEYKLDDPNVFDVSKYNCSCGNEEP